MTHQLDQVWPEVTPPPTSTVRWRWTPRGLPDLARIRREFRAHIAASAPEPTENALVEMVSVLDELASNALRHGHPPVAVEVREADDGLLVLVSDAGSEPPRPDAARDPILGGMGLGMVAACAVTVGWHHGPAHKTVWALLPPA